MKNKRPIGFGARNMTEVETAYVNAINKEIKKTFVPNFWSAVSNEVGSFYPRFKYLKLQEMLNRYRKMNGL